MEQNDDSSSPACCFQCDVMLQGLFAAMLSPEPLCRDSTIDDVDFVLPQSLVEQAVAQRGKAPQQSHNMGDMSAAGKAMMHNIGRSKVWRALRADFKAHVSVDREAAPRMITMIQALVAVKDTSEIYAEVRMVAIADSLAGLQSMGTGEKKLREGGVAPLISDLMAALTVCFDIIKKRDSDMSYEDRLTALSDLLELCKLLPGADTLSTEVTSLNLELFVSNPSSKLALALKATEFYEVDAVALATPPR